MILRGPLNPNMSQGGEGVEETPIVSKGLSFVSMTGDNVNPMDGGGDGS